MNPQTSNFEKFRTGNPVVRRLIDRFFVKLEALIAEDPPTSVLDAGCGEGMTLHRLAHLMPAKVAGFDLNPESVEYARQVFPKAELLVGNIYDLPYPDSEYELVICCEVLEHLPDPEAALDSLRRVAGKRLVVSVPHEPWFRLGSLLRGKYLKDWGNHPEHINHWNPRSFRELLRRHFPLVRVDTAFPWILAEARR